MTKMYVVTGTSGEYSDHSDWNICVCTSEARADEIADKLRKLKTYKDEFNSLMRTEFDEVYEREHPRPQPPYPDKPAVTERFRTLSSRKKETGSEREEYHILNKEHLAKIKVWEEELRHRSDLQSKWYSEFTDAQQAWRLTNFNPPEDLKEVVGLFAPGDYYVDVVDLID